MVMLRAVSGVVDGVLRRGKCSKRATVPFRTIAPGPPNLKLRSPESGAADFEDLEIGFKSVREPGLLPRVKNPPDYHNSSRKWPHLDFVPPFRTELTSTRHSRDLLQHILEDANPVHNRVAKRAPRREYLLHMRVVLTSEQAASTSWNTAEARVSEARDGRGPLLAARLPSYLSVPSGSWHWLVVLLCPLTQILSCSLLAPAAPADGGWRMIHPPWTRVRHGPWIALRSLPQARTDALVYPYQSPGLLPSPDSGIPVRLPESQYGLPWETETPGPTGPKPTAHASLNGMYARLWGGLAGVCLAGLKAEASGIFPAGGRQRWLLFSHFISRSYSLFVLAEGLFVDIVEHFRSLCPKLHDTKDLDGLRDSWANMEIISAIPAKRESPDNSDDTGSSMSLCNSRKRIPSEEWEKKRPVITQLYQEEKKSLREVMEILEREHRFKATVKMYKSRIWKWGLDKKLKGDEVLAIMLLRREREAQNKPTEFTIRGQPVDMDNINRYIRRNPSLMAKFRAGQMPSIQTTLEVQCRTPPPSPGRAFAPRVESYHVEEVLGLFRDYLDGSFTNAAWDCEYNVYCMSHKPGDRSDELFERVIASFALVNRCMIRGDEISISAMLNPAFESLKEIIATESPVFVVRTVCLLWYLDRHHKNDLLRLVMDYLAGLIPIVLGQHHIMTRIWKILGTTRFTDYYELSMCLYSVLVPILEERIGPANYLTTMLYGDHIDCVFSRSRPTESLAVASRYRAKADATGKRHPWLIELAIAQTAVLCAAKEAEGLVGEAMECLQTLKRYGMAEEQEAVVNIQLGNYAYQMGDMPSAVCSYKDAARLAVNVDGDERLMMTCLANLESALTKQGSAVEAARIRHYRLKRLSDFAKESSEFANLPHDQDMVPSNNSVCEFGTSEREIPSWIWEDDGDDLSKGIRAADTTEWLGLPMNPGGWAESVAECQLETLVPPYENIDPLLEGWE
ncbi:hypothetical protein G7046_g6246 [Stylonectria norvegica]|nr:hypothetical protein G7046_g6246 [Stylonectria norvegica]